MIDVLYSKMYYRTENVVVERLDSSNESEWANRLGRDGSHYMNTYLTHTHCCVGVHAPLASLARACERRGGGVDLEIREVCGG